MVAIRGLLTLILKKYKTEDWETIVPGYIEEGEAI